MARSTQSDLRTAPAERLEPKDRQFNTCSGFSLNKTIWRESRVGGGAHGGGGGRGGKGYMKGTRLDAYVAQKKLHSSAVPSPFAALFASV